MFQPPDPNDTARACRLLVGDPAPKQRPAPRSLYFDAEAQRKARAYILEVVGPCPETKTEDLWEPDGDEAEPLAEEDRARLWQARQAWAVAVFLGFALGMLAEWLLLRH